MVILQFAVAASERQKGPDGMSHQVPVTVQATIGEGQRPAVADLLADLRDAGQADGRLPFHSLPGVHFARLFVLDGATDSDGVVLPDSLFYMADVDGSVADHLRDVVVLATSGLDAAFGHCVGYPADPDNAQRLVWLRQHSMKPAAYYVHTVGRTSTQIQRELQLHNELAGLLDDPSMADGDTRPIAIRRRLVAAVLRRPDLAWAARRPDGPGRTHMIREAIHAVAVPLAVLPFLPLLMPVAVVWMLLLRGKEQSDWADSGPADRAHVAEVEAYEDHRAQNPFTAAGFVKPGVVRRTTMRVALFGLDYASRHVFKRNNLAGVRTIHFARWQPIDDGRRVIFASSYDGSQESYMDDFIDRLHWGVNLVFCNGVGYPRTRWLITKGARDEVSYKQYLRKHQVPTVVFYSAYDTLSAHNVDTNSRARNGLRRAMDEPEAARWLAEL